MILLIDNYDSFTYNVKHYFNEIGADVETHRNDKITIKEIEEINPKAIVLSPGPCTPNEAGISLEAARQLAGKIPLLGVCLGHQSIAQAFGASIVRAGRLMHGKTDQIYHDQSGLFTGLPNPIIATRYHSLIIDPPSLSDEFEVTAWSDAPDASREIMGIRHRQHPLFGVQFHPESFLTREGGNILSQFLLTAV